MKRKMWLSARTSVGVDQILCVAVADVEEKARFVQVHELGVIIHTVKHLWVDWLCNGCMEVVGPITVMKTYMHGVRGSIEVEHVPEDVALRSVREPECGQVVALLLRPSRGGAVATVHVLFRRGKWRLYSEKQARLWRHFPGNDAPRLPQGGPTARRTPSLPWSDPSCQPSPKPLYRPFLDADAPTKKIGAMEATLRVAAERSGRSNARSARVVNPRRPPSATCSTSFDTGLVRHRRASRAIYVFTRAL